MNFFINICASRRPRSPFTVHAGALLVAQPFHTTTSVGQRPDHRMFKSVDWDQVKGGRYAVLDPLDASSILYLSIKEYLAAQKVWLSNDVAVVVLATPSDPAPVAPSDPSDPNKKSPPRALAPGEEMFRKKGAKARIWSSFLSPLKGYINRYAASKSFKKNPDDVVSENVLQPVVEVNEGNLVNLILEWGDLLHFRLFGLASGRGFRTALETFASHVLTMYKTQGGLTMAKRLRIYAIVIKSYLGGVSMKTTQPLGCRVRLSNGLPSSLPASARSALRSKSVRAFRAWISVMHSYKAMVVKHPRPDLSSIVASAPVLQGTRVDRFRDFCLSRYPKLFKDVKETPNFDSAKMHISFRSGPNGKALDAIPLDALAWALVIAHKAGFIAELTSWTNKDLYGILERVYRLLWDSINGVKTARTTLSTVPLFAFGQAWGCLDTLHTLFESQLEYLKKFLKPSKATKDDPYERLTKGKNFPPKVLEALRKKFPKPEPSLVHTGLSSFLQKCSRTESPPWAELPSSRTVDPKLAKLAFLEEPAGKVRAIAIVDWFTQQMMKPIHRWMFALLRTLPSDATFDQEGAVKRFAKTAGLEVTSFDLKSATEMIPQDHYLWVMSGFFSPGKAEAWLQLLVDRWFHYGEAEKNGFVRKEPLRYRRGQPMGALSSWASMALVHHAVLQFSALEVGRYPFWDYVILGDDIVISGQEVADAYQQVCSDLGIPLSIPKSLRSVNGTFDFASQILQGEVNYSPLSLREELAAEEPGRRIECTLRSVRRGLIDMSKNNWFSAFLRFTISPTCYKQVVEERNNGRLDPVAKAVQIHTLGSLESPFHRFGLLGGSQVSVLESFRAVMPRLDLFSSEFKTIFSLGNNPALRASLVDVAFEVLSYKTKYIVARYRQIEEVMKSWTSSIEEKGFLASAHCLLDKERLFLAPILSHFGVIEDQFNSYMEWKKIDRAMLKNIEVATKHKNILNAKQLEDLTVSFWPVISDADVKLLTSPEMVLGVAPPEPVNIYSQVPYRLIAQAEQRFYRLGVWSELCDLSFHTNGLGLSGLDGPDLLKASLDAQTPEGPPSEG